MKGIIEGDQSATEIVKSENVKVEIEDVHAEFDVGNLCVTNIVELKPTNKKNQSEEWLKAIARKGTQMLIDKIWELPTEFRECFVLAKLPEPTINLPREKHIPKPKPPTRWEKFAAEKGITKKKKDKLQWDDKTKGWKPTYGYRSVKNDKSDWLIEIPDNADPNEDYFAKEGEKKQQKIAKNEYQRLRNIAEASQLKVSNLESVDKANKEQLSRSVAAAKTATASMGKFTKVLPKEKAPKNNMKKRKFEANIPRNMASERESNLKILEDLKKKKPKLDIKQAVQLHEQKKQKPSMKLEDKFQKKKKNKHNKKGGKRWNNFSKQGKNSKKNFGKNPKIGNHPKKNKFKREN